MTEINSLFALIKSLDKAEKRYFKLNAPKYEFNKGAENYMLLFDLLDAQKTYNKNTILKKFKGKLSLIRLSHAKAYLQQQVLNSLKNFHNDASENMKLSNYLAEIELLYKKKLFRHCLLIVKKAKSYAAKYEKLPELLKIAEWEILVASAVEKDLAEFEKLVHEVTAEAQGAINKYSELVKIRNVYFESYLLLRTGPGRTPGERAAHDDFMKHPAIIKKASTIYGEYCRLNIKWHNAQYKNDPKGINTGIDAIINHFETYPDLMLKHIDEYIHILIHWAYEHFLESRFIDAKKVIHKINGIIKETPGSLRADNKMFFLYVQSCFYMGKGEFTKGFWFADKMNALAKTDSGEVSPRLKLLLYFHLFDIHFSSGHYEQADRHIKQIINFSLEVWPDTQSWARIADLVLQYERKEYLHLGYMWRSVYRYLVKKRRKQEPETMVLNFLQRTVKFNSEKQTLQGLAELRAQLLPYKRWLNLPLIEWIDSKLKNKSMAEIFRENYLVAVATEDTTAKL